MFIKKIICKPIKKIIFIAFRWHDGFSVFYLGSDGLIHKLTVDKVC